MAGLCAAARARELGASPVVLEKGSAAGRLDAALERRDLALPELRGVPGRSARPATSGCSASSSSGSTRGSNGSSRSARRWLARETENPLTTGARFDTAGLTDVACPSRRRRPFRTAGDQSTVTVTGDPLVLATGGFQGDRRAGRALRSAGGAASAAGQPLEHRRRAPDRPRARRRADRRPRRVLRPQHGRRRLRRGRASSRSRRSTGATRGSSTSAARSSSTTTRSAGRSSTSSRRPPTSRARGPGTCSTTRPSTSGPLRHRPRPRRAGAHAHRPGRACPFEPPQPALSPPSASRPRSRTRSAACASTSGPVCSTSTTQPVDGLYAAGVDAGGISTGGYASGLASALVLGRTAAETALS